MSEQEQQQPQQQPQGDDAPPQVQPAQEQQPQQQQFQQGAEQQQQQPQGFQPMQQQQQPQPAAQLGMNQFSADPFPSNSDVLRMRGLPYTATEDDVRAFYEGYELADENPIVIISQGYHRGEGFVKFKSVEQCADAHAKLNRQCIGPRYIELYPSTESAMQLAAQQLQAMGDQKNFIIRLRGLPFQANEVNIYEFLGDITSSIANVQICTSFDGRSTGDAFVELTTQEALQAALEKNRSMMGPRYIEVFVSNAHERDVLITSARRMSRGRGRGGFNPAMGGRGRGAAMASVGPYQSAPRQPSQWVVRVRGLPFNTTEAQIAEFFHDVHIVAQGVHLVYNAQERPTGEAFVEVMSEHDCNVAMQHNGATMGHRYIEVFRSSGADMGRLAGAEEAYQVPPQYPPMQPQYAMAPQPYAIAPQQFYAPPQQYMPPQQQQMFVPPQQQHQQQHMQQQGQPQQHQQQGQPQVAAQQGRTAYQWSQDMPQGFPQQQPQPQMQQQHQPQQHQGTPPQHQSMQMPPQQQQYMQQQPQPQQHQQFTQHYQQQH